MINLAMTNPVSRSRKLLVGCLAAAGLAVAASPASATEYFLTFQTSSQSGDIYLNAPDWTALPPDGLPGTITGIEVTGSVVTSGGSHFIDSSIPQQVMSLVPYHGFTNTFGHPNDNTLLSFTNSNITFPPSSNLDLTWFDYGGFAVTLEDGTIVDLFVKPGTTGSHPRPPTFDVESVDINGHTIISPGTAELWVLPPAIQPVPGPTPATAGSLGLFGLALGAAALKLRRRFAR
jgi:hypothetical protein